MQSDNRRSSLAGHAASSSLYGADGRRKYLNRDERLGFLNVAQTEPHEVHTLCLVLAYTGCRISEALSLTLGAIQPSTNVIAIRSLKKRGRLLVREVPVPPHVVSAVLRDRHRDPPEALIWRHGRTVAWQRVKRVMTKAHIGGRQSSPRGLRHGFGVLAIQSGVPLNLVRKWLGHANIATTAIYTDAIGPEEREIAERMWM